ncbi:Thymidine phosphorylase [Pandoraea eparura]|uniref:Putative thymidine phosphorylase n=1 Tax=Pandoraea eparura TaxID=2508291 RepID=A0A5E4XI00_9BURK|nr:thymidine phosphorylase family protein [Pandoraea eparura]VVE35917.1 Thymidine phosphorylase [Pandoraea eparura]
MSDDIEKSPEVEAFGHPDVRASSSGDANGNADLPLTGRRLRARRVQIDTLREAVAYLRRDSLICRSEGFAAQTRLQLEYGTASVVATLQTVTGDWVELDEIGLSEAALAALDVTEGEWVRVRHMPPIESFRHVRGRMFGEAFTPAKLNEVIGDIAAGRYSSIHISAFLTACTGNRLSDEEIIALTRAMVATGETLQWHADCIVDKHSIGGLPGNRTTPIVVAIVSSQGLIMPKTSSRAITSPAGTADTMETLAPVDLRVEEMRRVVDAVGGCIVFGGAAGLSPADDILIQVERPLDLDSEAQMMASILSKKLAAGATHVLIDVPVGLTAKIRSQYASTLFSERLRTIGRALGLDVSTYVCAGDQPVGRGIGPSLEARDVLSVLQNRSNAPADLADKSVDIAGRLLEMGGKALPGEGQACARRILTSGLAWRQFQRICEAQGGMREPLVGRHSKPVTARHSGVVTAIDNRHLARVAKLAGAPRAPRAGVVFETPIGTHVAARQPLFTIYAESEGELDYAYEYAHRFPAIVAVGES